MPPHVRSNAVDFQLELASYLIEFAQIVKMLARRGLTDQAKGAEFFYGDLAKLIFEETFEPAERINQEVFDLHSPSFLVQVTCRTDARKLKDTLTSFGKNPANKEKKLYFILTAERPVYRAKTFEAFAGFDPVKRILGLSDLLGRCSSLDKLEQACQIARHHLSPKTKISKQEANKALILDLKRMLGELPAIETIIQRRLCAARVIFNRDFPDEKSKALDEGSSIETSALKMLHAWVQYLEDDLTKVESNPIEGDFSYLIELVRGWSKTLETNQLSLLEQTIAGVFETAAQNSARRALRDQK